MPRLIVVVVEPLYPANVGYIARAMRNFGLSRLRVVNPKLALTGASKYAMHASGIIRGAKTFDNLEEAVKEVDIVVGTTAKPSRSLRNVVRKAISARQFAQRCGSCQATVALIFGREDNGLSNEELRRCDLIVTIPADSKHPTLNLATPRRYCSTNSSPAAPRLKRRLPLRGELSKPSMPTSEDS